MRTRARFDSVAASKGHYESFYLKAVDPAGGRGVWLRHTTFQRPGQELTGSMWLTLFDSDEMGPHATKATFPAGRVEVPEGGYISIAGATLAPGLAEGRIETEGAPEASWSLRFDKGAASLRHLARERLYRSKLPKTKLLSPHPATMFTGEVTLGSQSLQLDGWPGMIGHNWGSEHAQEWIWMQASDLDGTPGDFLDVGLGRVKVGAFTTPWIASGALALDGERLELGGIGRAYGTEVEAAPASCTFTIPGKNVNVKGTVNAPAKDFVAWVYADPTGPDHNAMNCSISDIELRIERPGERHAKFTMAGVAAYELGTRDTSHGHPLQPFTDG